MKVLVTGANGFVGNAVCSKLTNAGVVVRPVVRTVHSVPLSKHLLPPVVADFEDDIDWTLALEEINVVIHLAARVHIMNDKTINTTAAYQQVNVSGTLNLARQAAALGVRRFIFISTIKVNGEITSIGRPFTAADESAPVDAYGKSKAEAEVQLMQLARETGMEVTVIRPPLIYGVGVKGNLAMLIKYLQLGLPLPLGSVTQNRRSLVGLDNLVDLIQICLDHPNACNQIFLVSDGEDFSTAEFLKMIGVALGQPAFLFRFPVKVISLFASLLRKKSLSQRFLGSLQVDIQKTTELLDWKPSVNIREGLRRAVN